MAVPPISAGDPRRVPDPIRLADILERVARGDPSVTDEVFWLQMHEEGLVLTTAQDSASKPM